MLPEAVPLIRNPKELANLVITNKVAVEIESPSNVESMAMSIKSAGKDLMIIGRVSNIKFIRESSTDAKWIVIVSAHDGFPWLKYLVNLVNVIPGVTLDLIMKLIDINPQLLNLPNELFLDPIISIGNTYTVPEEVPKKVLDWINGYIASGGDLYLKLRYDIKDLELISRARLLIVDNVNLAELYNRIIKGDNQGIIVKSNCSFCSDSNALCILLCKDLDLVRELPVSSL